MSEPDLLVQLSRVLASTPRDQPLPMRMCVAFLKIVGVSGVALTVGYAAADRTTVCATDSLAERLEDVQDVLREGPSLDAFRTGLAVTGLTSEQQAHRWPQLSQALDGAQPVVALHSFPLRPDGTVLGVLTAYQSHDRGLALSVPDITVLTHAIAVAVVAGAARTENEQYLWGVRDQVSQATGMVVAQLRVSPADALAVLRAHAFAGSSTLAEVSSLVLERTLDFRQLDDEESRD